MKVSVSIDCTPTDLRRLIGQPDLFPIHQALSLAIEDLTVRVIADRAPAPSPTQQDLRRDRPGRAVGR